MNDKTIKALLNTNNVEDFGNILYEADIPNLTADLSLWDEEVISHYLKISGVSMLEFKDKIKPIDILY